MRKRLGAIATLIVLLGVSRAESQTCNVEQTWRQCYAALTGSEASTRVGDEIQAAVATTNTGKPDLSTISNTTLRDFLSFFTAAVGTDAVGEKHGAITLDYNLPVNLLHPHDVVKLQGIFAKPEIDAALKEKLGTNADAISALNDSFDEADDVTVSATYSPQTERFGRQLAMNDAIFQSLNYARLIKAGILADDLTLTARAADALKGAPPEVIAGMAPFARMGDRASAALVAFETAIGAGIEARKAEKALIGQIADLVNNQEQIYFSGVYRNRNSNVGANSFSIKATWEGGGKNLSKFLAQNRADCDLRGLSDELRTLHNPAPRSVACLARFDAYVVAPDRGLRWAFALDIQRTESNTIDLPQYNVVGLSSKQSDTQIISASVGKRLDPPTSSRERRIDFTGSYENVDGDSNKDDRLVASLTYTQELTDTFSLPITLTFANKKRFLTDEHGDRLGVHLAIAYKLPKL